MTVESEIDVQLQDISVKQIVTEELERKGTGGVWVWTLFFLCVLPNILNGFHVSSYVFLGHIPNDMWCNIEAFNGSNWTTEQIRNVSEFGLNSHGCTIWNWNYAELSQMTYDEALSYISTQNKPREITCKSLANSSFAYDEENGSTIVQEWDLVCDKAVMRTSAQVLVSIGKFIGASLFGIISDKYGRKTCFMISSAAYIFGSIITTVSPWYTLFLIGRLALGSAASGLFYSGFALLSENISVEHRSWMSIAYSASYPVGMLFLALAAYLIHPWRYLQLSLTIPGLLLILDCYFLPESPRWLLSKNRDAAAYKVLFKKKYDNPCKTNVVETDDEKKNDNTSILHKIKNCFKELRELYGPSKIRRMAFTCYFIWCVTSLSYYVTALNADNLAANRYLYVAITGCVDIPSYILPMILLKFMGRRITAVSLFAIAAISLLGVLAIPEDSKNFLVILAMLGRFGISGVYSVVTLHTAELFPTEIRNSALGTSSTMAHVGSMLAPYIVDVLGLLAWFIPTTICGSSVLVAGLLMLTLPETGTAKLKDHVEDEIQEEEQTNK